MSSSLQDNQIAKVMADKGSDQLSGIASDSRSEHKADPSPARSSPALPVAGSIATSQQQSAASDPPGAPGGPAHHAAAAPAEAADSSDNSDAADTMGTMPGLLSEL